MSNPAADLTRSSDYLVRLGVVLNEVEVWISSVSSEQLSQLPSEILNLLEVYLQGRLTQESGWLALHQLLQG